MWAFKRSHRYIRIVLLSTTTIVCISLLFIYIVHNGSINTTSAENPLTYSLFPEKLTDERCIPVCDSRNCIIQANGLLKSINPSVDPCENFHEFLCGAYEEKFSQDEGHSVLADMTNRMGNTLKSCINEVSSPWTVPASMTQNNLHSQLKICLLISSDCNLDLLENIEAEPGSAAEKLKILYDSCVNISSSELRGVEELRQVLNDVEISNWPYLAADFKFSNIGLPKLLATFRSFFEINFIGFILAPKSENNIEPNYIYVKVDFNSDKFKKIPVIAKEEVADILGYFDLEIEDINLLFNDLENVRKTLLKLAKDGKEYLDECNKICPEVHLDCSTPREDKWAYVCEMVQVYLNVTNLKQYVKTNRVTIEEEYVFYVKNLIPRLKHLSDRSVANFFAFRLLWHHLSEINFFFRRKMKKYYKYFRRFEHETAKVSNKWQHCVAWIRLNSKLMLENELVKSYFKRPYINEIHDIHQKHVATIDAMIADQIWIPPTDRVNIRHHIKKLECNMAFNQRILPNDTYVNKYFEAFKPAPGNFLLNILSYRRSLMIAYSLLSATHLRKLGTKYEAGAFTNYEDEIVLYYGFLMPPAYYPGHEKFVNVIQLAHIISHEIGHSIYRKLNAVSKSSDITKKVYSEIQNCVNGQFTNFTFKILNENLNGSRYFEENFCDNIGFTVTDKLIDELESSEDVFLLPGLRYSLKQLFYMSSRQAWCQKNSRQIEILYKTVERHAPSEYRIIASGQNSKGYSEAFNCPEGSYMNPIKKCTVFALNS